MNIIENIWLKLKLKLQQRVETINTCEELSRANVDIWQSLPLEYIQGFYNALLRRMRKVLRIKGEMMKN
jgi:hypothetical protein